MADTAIVNVAQGALRGSRVVSKNGKYFYSFQGIPYARPPIGRFRFKAPQPPESWTGIRDARREGNVCPHIDEFLNTLVGDEDCLFVNVYTQELPGLTKSQAELKKAVMVYIHGGGFAIGSGNQALYGPDYLVDQDVVLVTFNYRLGPLGFLTTEDREIPGNAGLKDQVAALKWVKQNIARFGGDPYNVTIFGESAGAASVHYQMLSPLAKGLFTRAISQSGSALNSWAFTTEGRSRTVRLAKSLGCTSEDSKEVLAFLNTMPAHKIVENVNCSFSPHDKRRGKLFAFIPTSEAGIKSSEEKFLPNNPLAIIQSGNYNRVPYITGLTTSEGLLILREINKNPGILQYMDKDPQALLPGDLFPELDTEKSQEAADKVRSFYFGEKRICQETLVEYAKLASDVHFVYKINETVKEQSIHVNGACPIYYYQFAFEGQLGMGKKLFGLENFPGVCHADDLGYLFNISYLTQEFPPESPEMKMVSKMVQMWTNFAKTGKPSVGVTWEPVSLAKMCYLRIDEESTMMEDVEKESVSFWEEMYRKAKKE